MIGLLLAPRGLGTMLAMIVCGRLVTRIDPRLLLALGFVGQGMSTWLMSQFNLDTGPNQVFWAALLQGFGVGMMFVPLTMITFATLPVELRTDGSALFHLLRNLGSSIGIALAVTYLTRSTQHNRAELAEFASPLNEILRAPGLVGDWDLSSQAGPRRDRAGDQPPGVDDRLRQRLPRHDPAGACGLAADPAGPERPNALAISVARLAHLSQGNPA
jgi:MFS transporter, DHA2 family, multidrug resistance protein